MGRKTADSLPKNYLPSRLNIVLTRNVTYRNSNVLITNTFNKALKTAEENKVDTIWVIGGKEIYDLAFRHHEIDKVYVTVIDEDFNCDKKVE